MTASDLVNPGVEQYYIIKYPVKEKMKPAKILHRLKAQYGEETLSWTCVYDWNNRFSEGCKQVSNLPHAHTQSGCVQCEHLPCQRADSDSEKQVNYSV
jgi:hypothetical protein